MPQELIKQIEMQQKITNLLRSYQHAPMRIWIDDALVVLSWVDERLKKEQAENIAEGKT